MSEPKRDKDILDLIARHGLVTVEVLHHLLFRELTPKAVERVLTRMMRQELIQSHPLIGKTCYYALTPKSATMLGLDAKRVERPMGTQALVQNFSILLFCALGSPPRKRMTKAEFKAAFPQLAGPGLSSWRLYLDEDKATGKVRLAVMVPDFNSHPRRLVRKARREVEKRRRSEAWRSHPSRPFSVTVLTAFKEKAMAVAKALADQTWHHRIVTVPGFAQLISSGGPNERPAEKHESR